MSSKDRSELDDFLQDRQNRREFIKEELAFAATELVSELMDKEGVSKAELAKRVGKSKAYITQVLSSSRNMTMHTMADLVYALGYTVEIKAAPAGQVDKVEYQYTCRAATTLNNINVRTAGEAAVLAPQQAPHQLAA